MPTNCRSSRVCILKKALLLALLSGSLTAGNCDDHSDRLLDLLVKKGMLTQEEANSLRAEEQTMGTNRNVMPESKWNISKAIKSIEIYGDFRLRYEDRSVHDPRDGQIDLQRFRYALRAGIRGEVFDNFYYGLRLDTAANARSPWVTFGTSASGTPYQGPFGKSTGGIELGQIYLGWRPTSWMDLTVGKMPNPIYTTQMVWDGDINPEGAAERFKYKVGDAEFFLNFGQFLYQDVNPVQSSSGYFNLGYSSANPIFLLAWQGGVNYRFSDQFSAKVAPVLYNYTGHGANSTPPLIVGGAAIPDFSGTFVGQGTTNGAPAGTPAYYNFAPPGATSFDGFAANQTGINDLLVLDIPWELNYKLENLNLRLFGDYAMNLQGRDRANAAFAAQSSGLYLNSGLQTIPYPQTDDTKAYQIGFAVANKESLGLVTGATSRKHAWEFRTYWQHVEQYALDPNLLDSDFFEGRGNLQGIYAALAYGFTDNVIGTVRYGYARRINNKLGTGGSNQDVPQMNPINHYDLLQLDLTLRF